MHCLKQILVVVLLFPPTRAGVRSEIRGSAASVTNQRRMKHHMRNLTATPSISPTSSPTPVPTIRPTTQAPVITTTLPPTVGFFNETRVGNVILFGNRTPAAVGDAPLAISSDGKTLAVVDQNFQQNGFTVGQTFVYRLNKRNNWKAIASFLGGATVALGQTDAARSSVALSGDGNTLVVATNPIYSPDYVAPIMMFNGSVAIYRFVSNRRWKKMGNVILGGYTFGSSVAVSFNGTILAITTSSNESFERGPVSLYQWNDNSSDWEPLGDTIPTPTSILADVSLSADGTIVAIAAYQVQVSGIYCCGAIQVFQYRSSLSTWVQLGQSIIGTGFRTNIGYSVSLAANGMRFATGQVSEYSQNLLVYQFDPILQNWTLSGSFGLAGQQVVLSADGKTVAATGKVPRIAPFVHPFVQVFQELYVGTWRQIGNDVQFGFATALSGDGSSLAVYVDKFSVVGRDFLPNITVTVYNV